MEDKVRGRFIGLLAAALLLVAGFTAAAVASGGSPLRLLRDEPAKTGGSPSVETSANESTEDAKETKEEKTKDEKPATKALGKPAEHKVTICHRTGSRKHPFHPITVDEHALAAHTAHGDTVGPCPTTTPSTPGARHGKKKHGANRSQRSEHGRTESKSHRPAGKGGGAHPSTHGGGS